MHLADSIRAAHRIAGLTAGVVLCVLGLSGSVLIFRPELERLAWPNLFQVQPIGNSSSLEQLRTQSQLHAAGLELYRIRLAADPSSSVEFIFGEAGRLTTRVYVDPYTRRVLGVRTADTDPFLLLQALHFDLLARETGRKMNGILAVALLLLGVSGVVIWIRSTATLAHRLIPRWQVRPARRNWGLHMAVGIWGAPLLLTMGGTALYFAFHDPVAQFIYAVTFSSPRHPLPKLVTGPPAASLDLLLSRARDAEPAGEFTLIRLPRALGQPATANYVLPGDLSDLGANAVHLDPHNGEVLRVDRLRDMAIGPRIVAAFVPIHFGTFGRLPSRVLWALLGVLPSLLFFTGFAMWRRRRCLPAARSTPLASTARYSDDLLEVRKR